MQGGFEASDGSQIGTVPGAGHGRERSTQNAEYKLVRSMLVRASVTICAAEIWLQSLIRRSSVRARRTRSARWGLAPHGDLGSLFLTRAGYATQRPSVRVNIQSCRNM
jgi:hypothetical protein